MANGDPFVQGDGMVQRLLLWFSLEIITTQQLEHRAVAPIYRWK